jgi:hypothetical protein
VRKKEARRKKGWVLYKRIKVVGVYDEQTEAANYNTHLTKLREQAEKPQEPRKTGYIHGMPCKKDDDENPNCPAWPKITFSPQSVPLITAGQ